MSRIRARVERLEREMRKRQGDDVGEIIVELLPVEFDEAGNVIDRGVEIVVTYDEATP